MGTLNEAFVVETLTSSDQTARQGLYNEIVNAMSMSTCPWSSSPVAPSTFPAAMDVDVESAHLMYQQLKNYVVQRGRFNAKFLRPYMWIDLNSKEDLDQNKAWWGWEFETGYTSNQTRGEVIAHCWDNYDNVTFDGEGEGNYPCEITFLPANADEVISGGAYATKFIKHLSDNPGLVHCEPSRTDVGTHINISIPWMRTGEVTRTAMASLVRAMNRTLGTISRSNNLVYFGRRRLYGGFYFRESVVKGVVNRWLEGKLFRTTYSEEQFKTYTQVAQALTKAMELLAPNLDQYLYVTNLKQMFDDPSVEPIGGTAEDYRQLIDTQLTMAADGSIYFDVDALDNPVGEEDYNEEEYY